jgi:hypothetical protein
MTTEYIVYLLLATAVILAILVIRLELKMRRMLRGKNARTLEDTIVAIAREIDALKSVDTLHSEHLANVEGRLKRSIQGTSVLRFNPFKDVGSNQSFATAFLDEHGHGIVFSSLYSRDHTSVFAKPVRSYSSEFELTPEEQAAIEKARI